MYKDTLDFAVDADKCIRCGKCTTDCQNRAIEPDPETKLPRVAPDGGSGRCMHCRHCLMICPSAAISVDGINPADCIPSAQNLPAYPAVLDLIRSRRSVRNYKQKNVDKKVIAELMDAMRYVPTGVNFHQLHFGLIDDIDVMNVYRQKIYRRVKELFEAGNLPDDRKRRFESIYHQHQAGKDPVFRTAPHMLLVSVPADAPCAEADPLIAVSYFELLAHAHGLATCWFGRIMMMQRGLMPEIFAPFRLPEGYQPGYAILFGESNSTFPRTCNPDPVKISAVTMGDFA